MNSQDYKPPLDLIRLLAGRLDRNGHAQKTRGQSSKNLARSNPQDDASKNYLAAPSPMFNQQDGRLADAQR